MGMILGTKYIGCVKIKESKTYGVLAGGWHVGCRQSQLKTGQLRPRDAKQTSASLSPAAGHTGARTDPGASTVGLGLR